MRTQKSKSKLKSKSKTKKRRKQMKIWEVEFEVLSTFDKGSNTLNQMVITNMTLNWNLNDNWIKITFDNYNRVLTISYSIGNHKKNREIDLILFKDVLFGVKLVKNYLTNLGIRAPYSRNLKINESQPFASSEQDEVADDDPYWKLWILYGKVKNPKITDKKIRDRIPSLVDTIFRS